MRNLLIVNNATVTTTTPSVSQAMLSCSSLVNRISSGGFCTYFPYRATVGVTRRQGPLTGNKSPEDIMSELSTNSQLDVIALEGYLRALSYSKMTTAERERVYADPRFGKLIDGIESRVGDMDTRFLSMTCKSLATLSRRRRSDFIDNLAQKLAEVAMRRENSFNPRSLAHIVVSLPHMSVRDPAVIEFFRLEAMKVLPETGPSELHLLFSGFRHWGGGNNRELFDTICERMSDEIDRYTGTDVCNTLEVLCAAGAARGFLIRRLASLAFENLNQFTPQLLVSLLHSLSKLRFMTPDNYTDLIDVIKPNVSDLSTAKLTQLLYGLCLGNCKEYQDFVVELIGQLSSSGTHLLPDNSIRVAYTILYFQLKGKCSDVCYLSNITMVLLHESFVMVYQDTIPT
eukprot:GHVQ01000935.1.p1 GENE.GHVQ01000935.1~~GHVQ01000935.1.p1  ORF type:complete len:400 (+),score=34.99 GHVQ01000935.1:931-2130(+)